MAKRKCPHRAPIEDQCQATSDQRCNRGVKTCNQKLQWKCWRERCHDASPLVRLVLDVVSSISCFRRWTSDLEICCDPSRLISRLAADPAKNSSTKSDAN